MIMIMTTMATATTTATKTRMMIMMVVVVVTTTTTMMTMMMMKTVYKSTFTIMATMQNYKVYMFSMYRLCSYIIKILRTGSFKLFKLFKRPFPGFLTILTL